MGIFFVQLVCLFSFNELVVWVNIWGGVFIFFFGFFVFVIGFIF